MVRKLVIVLLACVPTGLSLAMTPEERREYRDRLLEILPKSPEFETWIEKTNELPPDFDALPRRNMLPDPLIFHDGRPVRTRENWAERRRRALEALRALHVRNVAARPRNRQRRCSGIQT